MIDSRLDSQQKATKGGLHREMILPLLTGVQCAGFFLYGTPVIYTQEVASEKRFGSQINSSQKPKRDDSFDFGLPRLGSCVAGYDAVKVRNQFEYLHENIEDDNLNDPQLEMMPILKNISKKNLIPIIDFEDYNTVQKFGPKATHPQIITVNYLTVYLTHTLKTLSMEGTSSALFKVPQMNTECL